jgi:hypothetical protein
MNLQSQLMTSVVLQLILPLTLLSGSIVHWLRTRRISSIGMIAGAVLVLVLVIASTAFHPLFPWGRRISTQHSLGLMILGKLAWLIFGGSFLWMAITAKQKDTEHKPGA